MRRGLCPSPENFLIFFCIKMVRVLVNSAAISYRLAACFTPVGSTLGIEIYWRSFRDFGNYNYSLLKIGAKMTIWAKKLIKKMRKNCVVFWYIFRIYSLNFFCVWWIAGPWPQ